jgi:two-component system, NtrC family, sensor kinase
MRGIILYVDDDEPNLTVFEAMFESEFHILTAESPREALEIMRQQEIAVLLTDQRMPEMSGTELAARVRTEFPYVIRLLITAYSDHDAAVAAINEGHVLRYLSKPWVEAELRQALREALELHHTARHLRHAERRLLRTERLYALEVMGRRIANQLSPALSLVSDSLGLANSLNAELAGNFAGAADAIGEVDLVLERARVSTMEVFSALDRMARPARRDQEDGPIDHAEVVSLTLKCMGSELRTRTQLQLDTEPVPPVVGSPMKLGQVMLNLLMNAQQRLADRPLERNLITVRLRTYRPSMVSLMVEDNGPGLDADTLRDLFDPLGARTEDGATALGLAISRAIVEELGGSIDCSSTPDKTYFRVELPASPG